MDRLNPNIVINNTSGLATHGNDLSAEPGSTAVADNVTFSRERLPELRRGFKDFSDNLPDFAPEQLIVGSNGVDRYLHLDSGLWYYDGTRWLRKLGTPLAILGQAAGAIWYDGARYYYITNRGTHAIYAYDSLTGIVSVLAGLPGTSGTTSATGVAARFNAPAGIWGDGSGNLYVADTGNFSIRKIVISTKAVTDFVGTSGSSGTTDATGTAARFQSPHGIWGDGANLWITERSHGRIRKAIVSSGVVSTLTSSLSNPRGLWIDAGGSTIYVVSDSSTTVKSVNASTGVITAVASGMTSDGAGYTYAHVVDGYLFTGSYDGNVVWRVLLADGSKESHSVSVFSVGVWAHSSSKVLVTGSPDPLVLHYWDLDASHRNFAIVPAGTGSSTCTISGPSTGEFSGPSRRIRSFEMNGGSFFASSRGMLKSTSLSAAMTTAGIPRFLDPAISEQTGTVFSGSGQVRAFRCVWGLRDANNNLILGDRSARVVLIASAGSKSAQLSFPIPPEITTSHFFQVYATAISTGSADPGDIMVQIFERNPDSSEVTAGTITWLDIIPDAFRNLGVPLYTNTDQEGSGNGNAQPPLARDVCEFRGQAFYANYTDKHTMTMTLVDAASLVADTSTVTIGGVVFTAHASEDATAGQFKKFTAGSAAQNVEDTAKSLCKVINQYAASTAVYAYYVSTPTTAPGKIILQERGIGGSAFVAVANNSTCGNCFVPPLPTSGSTYTSIADRRKNRIRVSKFQQPEHCPLARELVVGAENDEIQRVIPLRDSVIVVKDRSVWRITGSTFDDFVAAPLDDTTSCAGRDSYAKLNNCVFGLSNQGFIAITDNGVQIVGRPEEHRVLAGLSALDAPDHETFVGIGDEVKRLYVCRAYDAAAAKNVTYVYNAITRQWSRWKIDPNCLAVSSDRILYGLDNDAGHVLLERDSRRDGDPHYRDHADDSATFTISSRTQIDAVTWEAIGTFSGGVEYSGSAYETEIGYGWAIYDGSNRDLILSADDNGDGTHTLTVLSPLEGLGAGGTVYRPIPMDLEWNPLTGSNPGDLKQWGQVIVRAETQNAYKVSFGFLNEADSKDDPTATEWNDATEVQDAYVPAANATGEPSATNNDTTSNAITRVFPSNTIRAWPFKERSVGQQLSVRLSHCVAEGRLLIKALVVQARALSSNQVRP